MPVRPHAPADLPACVAALRRVHEASGYPSRWPGDPGWQLAGTQPATWIDPDGSTPTICCYVAPHPHPRKARPALSAH